MRRFSPVLLAGLLLASACGQDATSPLPQGEKPSILATPGAACTAAEPVEHITADIDALMAYLTPNNSSAQAKWLSTLACLAAGDVACAQDNMNTLINFINLKYGQANTTGVSITDPQTQAQVPIEAFKAKLLADIECYVALNSFDLNPGDPAKVFTTVDGSAGVWFPQGYVIQGYNVEITVPTTPPLPLLTSLDQYASFINIRLVDANGDEPPDGTVFNGLPVVVVCFPDGIDPIVADRLLLGHQTTPDPTGLELLPEVNVPQELADAVACGASLPIQQTVMERTLRKVADWLLPEKVYASFFAFGGVGGSPGEFSPFGAVDPGLNAFGGVGGSPGEFAPRAQPGASNGPMGSAVQPGGTHVKGTVDEGDVTNPSQLPQVRVITPNGTGVAGVLVTFTLSEPDDDTEGEDPPVVSEQDSEATLCGSTTATATTDAEGEASVPCINFGTVPGYKNLQATFDPSGVDPLACIINAQGACDTEGVVSVNFLVETTASTLASCTVSGNQKKANLAAYSSGILGYRGNLSIVAESAGSIRSAELAMSVTGQSSGTGGYTTSIRAYRAVGTGKGASPIASGTPYNASNPSDLTLRIPGNNGSPALIRFNLTPVAGETVAVGEKVIFEVQITASSSRTFQVWYNTKTTDGTPCFNSKVYAAGVTNFSTGAATRGVTFNIRNYIY